MNSSLTEYHYEFHGLLTGIDPVKEIDEAATAVTKLINIASQATADATMC